MFFIGFLHVLSGDTFCLDARTDGYGRTDDDAATQHWSYVSSGGPIEHLCIQSVCHDASRAQTIRSLTANGAPVMPSAG
jgi:hypothetical protein